MSNYKNSIEMAKINKKKQNKTKIKNKSLKDKKKIPNNQII